MKSHASHRRSATQDAVETGGLESQQQEGIGQQLLMRLAGCEKLLVQLEERLAHLQERRMRLRHLQEVAREWTEVTMRYRHLARN
jgi:hypothetical protein